MKKQILIVLGLNPSYGHKRMALEFQLNNKRIRRVMKKFGIKPYRRRVKFQGVFIYLATIIDIYTREIVG